MTYSCPHCQGRFDFLPEPGRTEAFCPRCGKTFDPGTAQAAPAAWETPTAIAPQVDEAIAPGTLLGQYRIEALLGRGGMGAVYRATQTSLERAVAIKVLPRPLAAAPEFVERFHREAKALAGLSHPHVVAIHDKGETNGLCYFVMELIDGTSLRQLLATRRPTPTEALEMARQACEALAYAHARGIIHRDVKPENLLVDRSGCVKVADFGLARIVGAETSSRGLTRSAVVMGTYDYMAPEQRESARDVDARADLYSLGVVMYEMLTGGLPLGRFEPPSKRSGVDPRVDGIVMRLLERDRAERWASAAEVKAQIEEVLRAPARAEAEPVVKAAPPAKAPRSKLKRAGDRVGSIVFTVFGVSLGLSTVALVPRLPEGKAEDPRLIGAMLLCALFLMAGVMGAPTPETGREVVRMRRRTGLSIFFFVWGFLAWLLCIGPISIGSAYSRVWLESTRGLFFAVVIPLVAGTFLLSARLRQPLAQRTAYGLVLVAALACAIYASSAENYSPVYGTTMWLGSARWFPIAPTIALGGGWIAARRLRLAEANAKPVLSPGKGEAR